MGLWMECESQGIREMSPLTVAAGRRWVGELTESHLAAAVWGFTNVPKVLMK